MTPDQASGGTTGTIAVRRCTADEQGAFFWPTAVSLFGRDVPTDAARRFIALVDPDRLVGAFDGDRIVGSAATHSFEMSVPGGTVPTAGVAAGRPADASAPRRADRHDGRDAGRRRAARRACGRAVGLGGGDLRRFGFGVAAFGSTSGSRGDGLGCSRHPRPASVPGWRTSTRPSASSRASTTPARLSTPA
jgi:hypothetical protein